jgi:hypothetical protein
LRYSRAFRERAWLGGGAHRQLPLHNAEESCCGQVYILFTLALALAAGVCFELLQWLHNPEDILVFFIILFLL